MMHEGRYAKRRPSFLRAPVDGQVNVKPNRLEGKAALRQATREPLTGKGNLARGIYPV
jgi:hypothetical protein